MAVLVAYASCHGSARGVAERIGDRLDRAGIAADACEIRDVRGLAGYEAAIIGSAVHGGRWLPDAAEFVRLFGPALHGRPVWLFSVSTVGDEEAMFPVAVARWMRAMRKDAPDLVEFCRILEPLQHRNFAGRVARSDWPLSGRLFFKAVGGRYGDHRNWTAIDAWADQIISRLGAGEERVPSQSERVRGHDQA